MVAAGKFWGVEREFRAKFGDLLIEPVVGLAYPAAPSEAPPAEALQFQHDPARLPFRIVLDFFFRMHDPTRVDQQFKYYGPEFRSAVFVHDSEQRREAQEFIRDVAEPRYRRLMPVATAIETFSQFSPAPAADQDYFRQHPELPRFGLEDPCGTHHERTWILIENLGRQRHFEPLLNEDGEIDTEIEDSDEDVEPEPRPPGYGTGATEVVVTEEELQAMIAQLHRRS
ncbi:hypothetical protein HK405_003239 [Cladochytrium tenue]|nr:hypothetical protein HK405_003239 [Cladochytrium tenue]